MATTGIEKELYPFSTEDSKAIPLDIIRPLSLITKALVSGTLGSVNIPASWKVASIYSDVGCTIRFGAVLPNPLVDGDELLDTVWIPPSSIVITTVLAGAASILPISTGVLKIQQIQKWSGLALKRQTSTR